MDGWVETVPLAQFKSRKKLLVRIDEQPVSLFKVGDQIYAFLDACIHKQRSLFKGTVLHGAVICPGHQWKFDLETGCAEEQDECQPTYKTKIVEGIVFVSEKPQ